MGFYRRIDVRMHGDSRFLSLSKPQPNGQTLFERMIHGPFSNGLGLYQAGRLAMAESLGWSSKAFDKAFEEVLAHGMAIYCDDHRVLYLPNFMKHNPPGSTNVAKNWVRLIDSLPECHLVNSWIQQFKAFAEAFPQAFRVPLPEAVTTASRTTTTTTTTTTTKDVCGERPPEAASPPSAPDSGPGALDPELRKILADCPYLALVSNGKSAAFWDQVLASCEPYGVCDAAWIGLRLRNWNQWFAGHKERQSKKRESLESRLMGWLVKDLESLSRKAR
jgi:hypothetical protein